MEDRSLLDVLPIQGGAKTRGNKYAPYLGLGIRMFKRGLVVQIICNYTTENQI